MSKDDQPYLQHILDALEKIGEYTRDMTIDDFLSDSKTVDAVVRNFEIVGEAGTKISHGLRDRHPHVPWRKIISLRNVLIHDYAGVDQNALWRLITDHLSELRRLVADILVQENDNGKR